jgi:phage terminase small subunit
MKKKLEMTLSKSSIYSGFQALQEQTLGRPKNHVNSRLTSRQQKFAEIVAAKEGELTLRECAEEAGYPAGSSHSRAWELLNPRKSPHVLAEVKRRRDELNEKYRVDYGRHLKSLAKLRDESLANGAYSAAVNAERLRGQAAGLYVSKSEIRVGSIDSMSKDQVQKELAELKKQLGDDAKIIEGDVVESRSEVLEAITDEQSVH